MEQCDQKIVHCHAGVIVVLKSVNDEQLVKIVYQILIVLKYLGSRKILHRDLKPDNILLGNNGKLKLGDFGISRIFISNIEHTISQNGTPNYMSPEILKGK